MKKIKTVIMLFTACLFSGIFFSCQPHMHAYVTVQIENEADIPLYVDQINEDESFACTILPGESKEIEIHHENYGSPVIGPEMVCNETIECHYIQNSQRKSVFKGSLINGQIKNIVDNTGNYYTFEHTPVALLGDFNEPQRTSMLLKFLKVPDDYEEEEYRGSYVLCICK